MKKIIAAIATLFLAVTITGAQDIKSGFELLKAGSESFAENKEQALQQFTEALGIFNEVGEVTDEEQQNQLNEYKAQCKSLIVKSLLGLAKENLKGANYDAAIEFLNKTVATGTEYSAEEDVAQAKELIPAAYKQKANSFLKGGDFASAIAAFQELLAITPEDGASFLALGQAYMKSGDLDSAIDSFLKASELGQSEKTGKLLSNCYLKKGQALLKAGKNLEAVEVLEKANSFLETANAYKLIANAYTKAGKNANAIEAYKKYLNIDPNAKDAADIMFTIAATAQKAGDKATAKEYYLKLKGNAKYGAQAEAQLKAL